MRGLCRVSGYAEFVGRSGVLFLAGASVRDRLLGIIVLVR
jgi:hypothetical protein